MASAVSSSRLSLSLETSNTVPSSPFPSPSSSFIPPPIPNAHEFAVKSQNVMANARDKKSSMTTGNVLGRNSSSNGMAMPSPPLLVPREASLESSSLSSLSSASSSMSSSSSSSSPSLPSPTAPLMTITPSSKDALPSEMNVCSNPKSPKSAVFSAMISSSINNSTITTSDVNNNVKGVNGTGAITHFPIVPLSPSLLSPMTPTPSSRNQTHVHLLRLQDQESHERGGEYQSNSSLNNTPRINTVALANEDDELANANKAYTPPEPTLTPTPATTTPTTASASTLNSNAASRPTSLSMDTSLTSNRPAPPSPASKRASMASSTRSTRSSQTPSRTGSRRNSILSRTNSKRKSNLLSMTSLTDSPQQEQDEEGLASMFAPLLTATPQKRRSTRVKIKVRDYAFPPADDRYLGLGPDVPKANKVGRMNRRLGALRRLSNLSGASATSSEDEKEEEEEEDDDGWCLGGLSSQWSWTNNNAVGALNKFVGAGSSSSSSSTAMNNGSGSCFPSRVDLDRNFLKGEEPDEEDPGDPDHEEEEYDEEEPLYPGLYRAIYAFEPEGTAEMKLDEDQIVRVVGRGGGVGWAVVVDDVSGADTGTTGESTTHVKHALVPESYLEPVKLDWEVEEERLEAQDQDSASG